MFYEGTRTVGRLSRGRGFKSPHTSVSFPFHNGSRQTWASPIVGTRPRREGGREAVRIGDRIQCVWIPHPHSDPVPPPFHFLLLFPVLPSPTSQPLPTLTCLSEFRQKTSASNMPLCALSRAPFMATLLQLPPVECTICRLLGWV